MKYYNYHCHNMYGNPISMDVIVSMEDYCKRAIELGHDAFFTTCHGLQGEIFQATTLAHQYNLKMIVGAELYYVKNRFEKDRSNRHIIIIALNHDGIRDLNRVVSESFTTGMYYKPRIDEELLFSLNPNNVIITTACVAGLWNDEELIVKMKNYFGGHLFLEVQDHNEEIQKEVNKTVIRLSQKYNIKIIHANDSHYIYPEDSKYRDLFLKAKGIIYEQEANFILDYPDYDEIVKRYEIQGILNKNQINEALQSTNVFQEVDCSDYINDEIKLPSVSENPNSELKRIINESWVQDRERIPKEKWKEYLDAIRYEVDIIEKTNMANYFLIDYNIAKIAKEKYNGVLTNTGRGCFTGDALVHTLKGIKPLKKVEIGDYVVTEDGRFNKVLNTFSYDIGEPMIKIKHLYGTDKYYPTICTRDHKILIYRNGNREWIEAQNIVKGDYVCVPKIKFKDNHLKIIDLNDYNDFGYKFDDDFIYEEYDRSNKRYNKTINRYIQIDRTFNEFIGLMYGDGFNNSTKNCDVGLAINTETDKDSINKMIFYNIANRLGVSVYENPSKDKKLNQLYIHSKIFNNFIKKELFQSKKGKDKEFNPKWFNQSKKMVEGIIFGLRNSDGSRATKTDHRISFDNTSLSIANAYKLMCLYTEYGVNSLSVRPIWDDKRGYKCKESYKLRINPNAQNTKKISERVLEDKEYYYLPVKEIERIKKQSFRVYDLEVENNHSYLINNMIVHNSAPSFYVTRLLHLTNIDRLESPITLFPTRFMSIERILGARSLPDIDLNTADAEPFIQASKDLLGENNCGWMISWKPLQESSGFRLYCKALDIDYDTVNEIAKDLDKYREDPKWKDIIEESKRFIGVVEGVSESPCSMLLYSKDVRSEIGMIKTPNGKICCMLDGYNCDKYKYLKNDYLTVTVWAIIRDVCKLANIPIPTINELDNLLDDKTFDVYRKGLTCSINQADSDYATGLVMRYKPKSLAEMSSFVAIIRPGCASLLDDFIERKPYTTGVKALDNILEDSEHRLIYQESIMKYLIWLGISEPQSYDVIKKIAKKKFKEPELKALKEQLLEGWHKQVGEENGFEETWQVVEDAAKYSFNASHSLSYAYDSLYGAYLKSHYPLEYYTVALNYYSNDATRTGKLTKELKSYGISLEKPSFRYSIDKYFMDKENNKIYKGTEAIKYLNKDCSLYLYSLREKKYDTFIDLLAEITDAKDENNRAYINSRQIDILIKSQYFQEFGNNKKLLTIYDYFKVLYGRKVLSKDKAQELNLPSYIFEQDGVTQTEKQYKFENICDILKLIEHNTPNESFGIKEQVEFENDALGYINMTYDVDKRVCYVLDIDTKYTPKVTLYCLRNGKTVLCKVNKALFKKQPLKVGMIIRASRFEERYKQAYVNGGWQRTNDKEWWCSAYNETTIEEETNNEN